MGFFKRKKNSPLSISMYQGDNATPARSPPRRGAKTGRIPLTPDPAEHDPVTAAAPATTATTTKKNPSGFFKRKNNHRNYVTVTPDKQDDESSNDAPQPSPRDKTTSSTTTPSKSLRVASSSPLYATPPSQPDIHRRRRDETDDDIPALVSPGKYDDLPPSPHDETKRNLTSAFHASHHHEGRKSIDRDLHATAPDDDDNRHPRHEENTTFLRRFRASWKQSPGKVRQKQIVMRSLIEQTIRSDKASENDPPSPVPLTIDRGEEGSIPSLITEPEEARKIPDRRPPQGASTTVSLERTASDPSREVLVVPSSQRGSSSRRWLTLGERVWSMLQCGEDTTSEGYFCRIKCLEMCAPVEGDGRDLRAEEEEDAFVVHFIHEISKRGIKLIYHQAPADSSSDWTQLTVRLFLRPGQCHEREVHPPSLSWATLPVASRKVLTGSYDNVHESGEDTMLWTHLNLWDVYSVMGAEDDAPMAEEEDALNSPARTKVTMSTTQSGFESRDTNTRDTTSYTRDTFDEEERTIPSSGFFSITAGSSGNVYVFEASSGSRRDYIVMGLKKMIGWATRQVILGKLDVCAELYGEDAAPMSGELPSLVTPSQALSRVTHAFLDAL